MKFLYAAYIATWLIHIGYLISLNTRVAQVRKDVLGIKREESRTQSVASR